MSKGFCVGFPPFRFGRGPERNEAGDAGGASNAVKRIDNVAVEHTS